MGKKIIISSGDVRVEGVLFDTPTADALWNALPLTANVNTWGDEIYFTVPVEVDLEDNAAEIVRNGDLGYWPSGPAFCIFFGPTPISKEGEIRPASAVNVFGRVAGDTSVLKIVSSGTDITVQKAD
jgi:hypothetical protein